MVPESTLDLPSLRSRVATLAERGIYVGTSSWKYAGWLGQIYTPGRYEYRGKFANTRFERDCLAEYAETFKTVCVDAAYYTWPNEKSLAAMRAQVPADFRFGFKVTDGITIKRFPNFPRFGERAGKVNEDFLNAPLFIERFLGPLVSIRENVGPIMFEFSKFYPAEYAHGADFAADLDRFLVALPKDWEYGVEIRNKLWLEPPYFDVLKKHGVAHVMNNWTQMPPVSEQINLMGDRKTENLTVARFLLKPGRDYETAVDQFQPYDRTQEVNDDARKAGIFLLKGAWVRYSRGKYYVYVNNRLEGNAVNTILAMLQGLNFELFVKGVPITPLPAPGS